MRPFLRALLQPKYLLANLPAGYWPDLASDYVAAYQQAFPSAGGAAERLPSRTAILLSMAVAEHETSNARAWPGTNNFGAVQLRSLTPAELAAYEAGTLKAGDYTPSRDGVLHVDTHPIPGGDEPYPVWFAAFPRRIDGIAHFLRTLYRDSAGAPDVDGATPSSLAAAMWQGGYYEETDHGKGAVRPVGHRSAPFPPEEAARIADYAGAVDRCLGIIVGALGAGWDFGRDAVAGVDGVTSDPAAAGKADPAA